MEHIFQEAFSHCRWKGALAGIVGKIDVAHYRNMSFEEIFLDIYDRATAVKGVGLLTVYDMVAALCRKHGVVIQRVYIVGGGPKRAVGLLGLRPKTQVLRTGTEPVRLKYIDIECLHRALERGTYPYDDFILRVKNGDELETYICNWQKNIP